MELNTETLEARNPWAQVQVLVGQHSSSLDPLEAQKHNIQVLSQEH